VIFNDWSFRSEYNSNDGIIFPNNNCCVCGSFYLCVCFNFDDNKWRFVWKNVGMCLSLSTFLMLRMNKWNITFNILFFLQFWPYGELFFAATVIFPFYFHQEKKCTVWIVLSGHLIRSTLTYNLVFRTCWNFIQDSNSHYK
jgi:hypothetical protein